MHYSPLVTGAGLLALGLLTPGSSYLFLAARLVLDLAGIGFLAIGLFFLVLNVYGALHHRLRPLAARAVTPGSGSTGAQA